ncbi:hypothetical protein V6N11_051857 [Hibiscus sabdariffa]|uniref:Uncharacterized protein n=1 Tax=Hibiscus sabdariffa TaxID=183260 RepID=A0ABR2U8N5_9ROSI
MTVTTTAERWSRSEKKSMKVHGFVEDLLGKKVATLIGKWDDNMHYISGDGSGKSKDYNRSNASLLRKRNKPPPNLTHYNLTSFEINEVKKTKKNGCKPRRFHRDGESGSFRHAGGYWEARERGKWDGCPNIFGEFNEESVDTS